MNFKRNTKTLIKSLIILIICIIIGSVLVTVANYIPVDELAKQKITKQLDAEGLFPYALNSTGYESGFLSNHPGTLELSTDRLMVKMSLYNGELQGYRQAFFNYDEFLNQGEYSRYWHGYVAVLRPLFRFFDYDSLKYINAIVQLILIVLISVLIGRKLKTGHVLAFISSVVLLVPWASAQCFQYSWIMYSYFAVLIVYLCKHDYFSENDRIYYLFTVSGALTIFLDLMTFPLVVWGGLALWWTVLSYDRDNAFTHLKNVVCSGIYWLIGYVGMWGGKLIVGSIVLRMNLFAHAFSEMQFWMEGTGSKTENFFEALSLNFKPYEFSGFSIILILWGIFFALVILVKGFSSSAKIPAFMLIAVSSFAWYFVMSSHSVMHHIFTFRTFNVCMAAMFVMTSEQYYSSDKRVLSGKTLPVILSLVVSLVVSFIFMTGIRNDYEYHNGDSSFIEYTFSDDSVSFSFSPRFDDVKGISIGLVPVGDCKNFNARIYDAENNMVCENHFVYDGSDGLFCRIGENLKLIRGRTYTVFVTPEESGAIMYVTNERNYRTSEAGTVIVNGVDSGCYPFFKIAYRGGLDTPGRKLLYMLSMQALILMMTSAVTVFVRTEKKKSKERAAVR